MTKPLVVGLVIVLLVGGLGYLFYLNKNLELESDKEAGTSTTKFSLTSPEPNGSSSSQNNFTFGTPKKSAHYETNTPNHGSTLASVPLNVVIDFNFDLAPPSEIKIMMGGKEYGLGQTEIDDNKLSMRRVMDPNSPDGKYKVEYNACWPDKTCHDGYFEFAIDRSKVSNYQDMTGQKNITLQMSQIKFVPENIKISKGTKVLWANDDTETHYVNTDSHPAHTYYPSQNSKALQTGHTYTLTFNTPGIYPYHCSAHEANMKGSIIVE